VYGQPKTSGGGTRPTIKVTPTAKADLATLEYSGLSTASGIGAIDQTAQKSGTTSAAATVSSGATSGPTTADGELVVGFYVDSGFGDTLTTGSGFTGRTDRTLT
jgi:hypothetical protein